jgi:hypothetical protein
MGRCRGRRLFAWPRPAVLAIACAAAALAVAGCGAQERTTEARPQPPTRVSVTVSADAVEVQPRRIAFGPEPTQQIPQNQHAAQPQVHSRAPLDVVLVAANLTPADSRLQVRGRGKSATSQPLVASGNVTLQTSLPTGVYKLSATGIPGARPATLTVGPYRSSSENDVLLP